MTYTNDYRERAVNNPVPTPTGNAQFNPPTPVSTGLLARIERLEVIATRIERDVTVVSNCAHRLGGSWPSPDNKTATAIRGDSLLDRLDMALDRMTEIANGAENVGMALSCMID